MKYVKKPIPVEAIQIPASLSELNDWYKNAPDWFIDSEWYANSSGIVIPTLEGDMLCLWGSYIIYGPYKELYPCRKEVFESTYDEYTDN